MTPRLLGLILYAALFVTACAPAHDRAPDQTAQTGGHSLRHGDDDEPEPQTCLDCEATPPLTPTEKGLAYLEAAQQTWGEFVVPMCDDASLTVNCDPLSSPFGTTFVVYALAQIDDPASVRMQTKAVAFLNAEVKSGGWWPFWASRAGIDIAGDVDTTVTAAYAVTATGATVDNRALLMANRTTDTALFLTWFPDYPYGNTVDCVVNANALFYLGDAELPEVCTYLNDQIAAGAQCSVYYPDELELAYTASRAVRAGATCLAPSVPTLTDRAWARLAAVGPTALETALAMTVLSNLGAAPSDLTAAAAYLESLQNSDGSWPAEPFWCIDCTRDMIQYFGSRELTTGFALEALARAR